ncbi:MAG: YceD family protein [Prevotella sp.]
MCSLGKLHIDLKALKVDDVHQDFQLNNDFFKALEEAEVEQGDVKVALDIHRTTDRLFDLNFHLEGNVVVKCDRCLDDMVQPIKTDGRLCVKLGEEYSEEDDLVVVDESEGCIDLAWFVYEFIALNIPIKHVHAPGKCNRVMIDMLEKHSATRSGDEDNEKPIDPRWSGLLKLKEIKD